MDSEAAVATASNVIAEVKVESVGGNEPSQPIKSEAYVGQEEEKENEELPAHSSGESDALPGHEEIIDGFSFLTFDLESDLKVNSRRK